MNDFFNSSWQDWKNLFNFKYTYIPNLEKIEYDWEQLKKIGTVEETIEDKDGFITITKTFVSKDGKQTISSVSTMLSVDNTKTKLDSLNKLIQEAVKNEEYEKAAKLKEEKQKLINNK